MKSLVKLILAASISSVLMSCGQNSDSQDSKKVLATPKPVASDFVMNTPATNGVGHAGLTFYSTATELILKNTSSTTVTNLQFPAIIKSTDIINNKTGVDIKINSSGCHVNLLAGASCTFTALISAKAHAGSFTVNVTGDPLGSSTLPKVMLQVKEAFITQPPPR